MTPLDILIFIIMVGFGSIYVDRRREARLIQKALAANSVLDADQSVVPFVAADADVTASAEQNAGDARPTVAGERKTGWKLFGGKTRTRDEDKVQSKKRSRKNKRNAKRETEQRQESAPATVKEKKEKKRRGWKLFGRKSRDGKDKKKATAEEGSEQSEAVAPIPVKKKRRGLWRLKGKKAAEDNQIDGTATDSQVIAETEEADQQAADGGQNRGDAEESVKESADKEKLEAYNREFKEQYNEARKVDYFGLSVAILIALVTVTGAWIGWSISTVYGEVSNQHSAGLSAALNVESTLTNSSVDLYKEYRVYTEYTRYQTLADLEAGSESDGSTAGLPGRKSDDADLAAVQLPFFLSRYLTRDGGYDRHRQLGEAWAEAAQRVDLEPAPHFAAADAWQRRTESLVGLFIALILTLLLLTLAEALNRERKLLRYGLVFLGTLLLIFTVLAKFWIELG